MQEIKVAREHSFSSKNREGIKICGTLEVLSFDTSHVKLNTLCGGMIVEGDELRVSALDKEAGVVEVTGTVNGVFYFKEDVGAKKGLFGRNK